MPVSLSMLSMLSVLSMLAMLAMRLGVPLRSLGEFSDLHQTGGVGPAQMRRGLSWGVGQLRHLGRGCSISHWIGLRDI